MQKTTTPTGSNTEIDNIVSMLTDADEQAEVAASLPKPEAPTKEEKPAKRKRVFYSKQSDRIKALVGNKKVLYSLTEKNQMSLDDEKQSDIADTFYDDLDKLAKKVGEKAYLLFKWYEDETNLNYVLETAFGILHKEGNLTSGAEGNLRKELLVKYSEGTAASQANQVFQLFPALGITDKAKGKIVLNENSLHFERAVESLGLE